MPPQYCADIETLNRTIPLTGGEIKPASLLPLLTVHCRHSQRSGGDRWWKMKAPTWLFAPLLLFLSSPPLSWAAGNEPEAANCCSTRRASPQTPRTNTVERRFRGPQRTVRGGGQAAPIAWRSVPMTPISAQLPPHPSLVAGISFILLGRSKWKAVTCKDLPS